MSRLKLPKLKIYKPYLMFYFDIGFFRIRTEMYVYTYIRLDWSLFKWNGGFNLYKPGYDTPPKKENK